MRGVLVSIIFVFIFHHLVFPQVNQFGNPFVKNYSLKDYGGKNQNWAIAKDTRGVMYFANNDGVLEYDGRNWELIKVNKGAIVRSLAIDSSGVIYVGAENEFGYIKPNRAGKLIYRSLSDSLKGEDQGFSNINKVYITSEGVFYCSNKKIFKYKHGQIFTINLSKGGFLPHLVNNNLYMGEYWKGLMVLEKDSFKLCQGGSFFSQKDIFDILPFKNNSLLVATINHGLYVYGTETGKVSIPDYPNYRILHRFITEKNLYSAHKYKNGFRFNTLYGGALIVDSTFTIIEHYNKSVGLQDHVILNDFLDNECSAGAPLWLALNNGISKVECNSPFRIFNELSGLPDEVLSITQYKGKLFFATINGVYTLEYKNQQPFFKKIEQTEGECWSMTECDGNLIIGSSYRFYIHNGTKTKSVETDEVAYNLYASRKYSNRIYVGEDKGISIFYLTKNGLKRKSKIQGISHRVTNIIESDDGNLWVSTSNNEIVKIIMSDESYFSILKIDTFGLKPIESLYPFKLGKEIYFSTQDKVYTYDKETNRIVYPYNLDSTVIKATIGLRHLAEDNLGNIWLESQQNGKLEIFFLQKKDNNRYWLFSKPFKRLPPCVINHIYPDNKGIVWFGTSEGLFTFNTHIQVTYDEPFSTLIRKVIVGEDSVLFHGVFSKNGTILINQPSDDIPKLGYKNNGLTFHFASPYFIEENETLYSYYLQGFDSESSGWSNWTRETKKEYTNLHEGSYVFRVKAKNIYGNESSIAEFAFQIHPPWYRTITAYISYTILLFLFVWIIVKLNIRRLELEKIKLEGIVAERTAEIRQQKDKIQKQNEEITDSIKYAKRIQTALLPPPELISEYLPEHFILYKPRDIVSGDFYWMKQLGDITIIAAADCTGHGVPGAFMSMLGIAFLNEVVSHNKNISANLILKELRERVKQSLRQTGKEGEAKDGMDLALCILNRKTMKLEYAGAYNPLYLFRRKANPSPMSNDCIVESDTHYLIEIKADKMPIGIHVNDRNDFTNHVIDLMDKDTIYVFSDGFVDQTGGENDKKFLSKNFKNLLLSIQHLDMISQKEVLDKTLKDWMGSTNQVDDILVVGVRI